MKNLSLLIGFLGFSILGFAQNKNHLVKPISKLSTTRLQPIITKKPRIGIYKTQKFLKGPRAKNLKPWQRTGKWIPIQSITAKKHFLKGPAAKNYSFGQGNPPTSKNLARIIFFKGDPFLMGKH